MCHSLILVFLPFSVGAVWGGQDRNSRDHQCCVKFPIQFPDDSMVCRHFTVLSSTLATSTDLPSFYVCWHSYACIIMFEYSTGFRDTAFLTLTLDELNKCINPLEHRQWQHISVACSPHRSRPSQSFLPLLLPETSVAVSTCKEEVDASHLYQSPSPQMGASPRQSLHYSLTKDSPKHNSIQARLHEGWLSHLHWMKNHANDSVQNKKAR